MSKQDELIREITIYLDEEYARKTYKHMAEEIIALCQKDDKWVSVDTPPNNPLQDSFLVYTTEEVIEGNALYNNGWMFWSTNGWKPYGDDIVTNWKYQSPPEDK